jgi:outer membrane biosynthesis protein TonB
MKPGLTISFIGHAAALAFGIVAISAQPMESPPVQTLPVSFISDKDFTQLTQGVKNAPQLKVDMPKPLADKVDAPKAVDQLAPKAADKPAITTDTKPKTEPKTEPKPDPKQAAKPDKPKPPEYKPDQIADLLKKDADKKPPKPDDNKPDQNSPKFDADQVAQLLDKRDPRRQLAAAETLNDTATLGASNGAPSAKMSQSEIDALRARISSCWSPPAGVDANSKVYVVLRVLFKADGSIGGEPALVEGSASALGPALAESAKRALLSCQPFTMLRPEHYDQWKDLELKFDPQELLGG